MKDGEAFSGIMARAAAFAFALACAAGCSFAAQLDDIPGTEEVYTAAQTDAAIRSAEARLAEEIDAIPRPDYSEGNAELVATIDAVAPAPGDYATVSNRAMQAIQSLEPATNYTDAATNALKEAIGPSNEIDDGTNIITAAREVYLAPRRYPDVVSLVGGETFAYAGKEGGMHRWGTDDEEYISYDPEDDEWIYYNVSAGAWDGTHEIGAGEQTVSLTNLFVGDSVVQIAFTISTNLVYVGRLALTNDITAATNALREAGLPSIENGTNRIDASGAVFVVAKSTTDWTFDYVSSGSLGGELKKPYSDYIIIYWEDEGGDVAYDGAGWYIAGPDGPSGTVFSRDPNLDRIASTINTRSASGEYEDFDFVATRKVAGRYYHVGNLALTNDLPNIASSAVAIMDDGTSALQDRRVQIGSRAVAGGFVPTGVNNFQSVAIGNEAQTASAASVAVGPWARSGGSVQSGVGRSFATAIGYRAVATKQGSVAIGSGPAAGGFNYVNITNEYSGETETFEGLAVADAVQAVQIGKGLNSTPKTLKFLDTVVVGQDGLVPTESLHSNIVTASGAAYDPFRIAIGNGSKVPSEVPEGYGNASGTEIKKGIALGSDANIGRDLSVALGPNAKALGANSLAIGYNAVVNTNSNNSVAIGPKAKIEGSASVRSVQLGIGTLQSSSDTLQFRNVNIMRTDSSGNIPLWLSIPCTNKAAKAMGYLVPSYDESSLSWKWSGLNHEDEREISMPFLSSTGGVIQSNSPFVQVMDIGSPVFGLEPSSSTIGPGTIVLTNGPTHDSISMGALGISVTTLSVPGVPVTKRNFMFPAEGGTLSTASMISNATNALAQAVTSYTDAVAAEFADGTRTVGNAARLDGLAYYDIMATAQAMADAAARAATNYTDAATNALAGVIDTKANQTVVDSLIYMVGSMPSYEYVDDNLSAVAQASTNYTDASISTNNAAFVAAVLAAPLAGASASDIAEIGEYGTYGTVGAALLALIAGLAALKRRMGEAETSLAGKADAADLRYALIQAQVLGVRLPASAFPVEYLKNGITTTVGADEAWRLNFIENASGWSLDCDTGESQDTIAYFDSSGNITGTVDLTSLTFGGSESTILELPTAALSDRAVNAVSVSSATTLTLPPAVPGYMRDLIVRLDLTALATAPEVTFAAPTGETITWDDTGSPTATYEAGTHLLRFTEVAPSVFHFTDLDDGGSIDPAVINGKMEATSAAPAFDPTKTYSVSEYVTYEGVLYKCSTAVTTAGAWTGSTNWTATDMTSPDATLDLMADGRLRLVSTDGDVLWMQGYGMASASSVTLSCDKVNFHAFTEAPAFDATAAYAVNDIVAYDGVVYVFTAAHAAGEWTGSDASVYAVALEMPTAPSGKVGDFVLDVDNTANASASVTATLTGAGTAFDVFTPEGVNLSTDILTFAGGEQCELYFTMTAFGTAAKPAWKVVKQIVEKQEFGS